MAKTDFDPTWRELLRPIVIPQSMKTSEKKPTREPFITKSYVHLVIKLIDHPNDFNKKLQIILQKHEPLHHLEMTNIDLINQDQFINNFNYFFKVTLKPFKKTNKDVENSLIDADKYVKKVLAEIPAIEFVEYGVTVQTFNLDFPEVYSDTYKKRVNFIANEFIKESLVRNGKVRYSNLRSIDLYENNKYDCKSRLFMQYSTSTATEFLTDIVKHFINHFNSLNELQLILEFLFLDNYNLTKTLSSIFKSLLLETIRKRSFFSEFFSSPVVISATHGLQSLCKEMISELIIRTHVNLLVDEIHKKYDEIDLEDSIKLQDLLHCACKYILGCGK